MLVLPAFRRSILEMQPDHYRYVQLWAEAFEMETNVDSWTGQLGQEPFLKAGHLRIRPAFGDRSLAILTAMYISHGPPPHPTTAPDIPDLCSCLLGQELEAAGLGAHPSDLLDRGTLRALLEVASRAVGGMPTLGRATLRALAASALLRQTAMALVHYGVTIPVLRPSGALRIGS